jgi:lipopolysaccharide biosynthesis protein
MSLLHDQYAYFRKPGPLHEDESSVPSAAPTNPAVRYIAYYLPQFHRIPENDKWWGPGFTEWSNVAGGIPRYVGQYQPRSPADLGFYDLCNVEVLSRQAALARRGGIHGFCIHNYWFSGKRLLETPVDLLLANPDIDLPFCLNWANESWSRRWDGSETDILIEQRYDTGDDIAYAESILPALADARYITVEGRPLLMIYRPGVIPEPARTIDAIRNRIVKAGLNDPLIVMPQVFDTFDPRPFGMDAAAGFPPHGAWDLGTDLQRLRLLDSQFDGRAIDYDTMVELVADWSGDGYPLFPGVCPMWDNDARKGRSASSFYGSTPGKYGAWLRKASRGSFQANQGEGRIVFINAWNEWAEGAYLEPDRHFGFAYLAETRRALDTFQHGDTVPATSPIYPSAPFRTQPSTRNRAMNLILRASRKIARSF